MKLTVALVVMLSLAVSALGQDFYNAALDNLDTIESIGEITNIDQAVHAHRYLRVLKTLLDDAESTHLKKRFIGDLFDKIKEAAKAAAEKVKELFNRAWNSAKEAVKNVSASLDFDALVAKILPDVEDDETVEECQEDITNSATKYLGPAAGLAGQIARPLCEAAIAKKESEE